MANSADHIAAGALAGVVMACYGQRKEEPVSPLLAIGASTVFSKLPDWIEPATNPNHRQFFHSIAFLSLLGYSLKMTYDWKPEDKGSQILRFLNICWAGLGFINS